VQAGVVEEGGRLRRQRRQQLGVARREVRSIDELRAEKATKLKAAS